MRLAFQILVVLQSAVVAMMLVRYDPTDHYAAAAQRATSAALGGALDACHRELHPGVRVRPMQTDTMDGRA